MKDLKTPKWAEYDTILEGVEKMQPAIESLKAELLAGQKAKKAGKPKRVAYHMKRIVNITFNLDMYFWSPMFQWAQSESFWQEFRHKATPMQKAIIKAHAEADRIVVKKAKKNA